MALDLKNIKSIVGLSGKTIKTVQTKAGKVLWKAGAIVTYVVDTATAYTEEVDTGASCLAPSSFTPTKSGWTFVGWREDTAANSSVLTSKAMEGEPITLYAVFRKTVTLTYYDAKYGKNTVTRQSYYNNSQVAKAVFENFAQTAMVGWISSGWSASTEGNPTIAFRDGATISIDSDLTLYGCYKQQITVTYYDNSTSASTAKGTRYYNASGNYANPSFTLTQATKSGWTARGWSTSNAGDASVIYNNATAFTRDSNVTLYGLYQQTITLKTVANGSTSSKDGTRYWAPAGYVNSTFTVSNPTKSGATFKGWSTSSSSTTVSQTSISGLSLSANATYYAVFKYDDVAVGAKSLSKSDAFMPEYNDPLTTTLVSSVDFSKYGSMSLSWSGINIAQNHMGGTIRIVVECGSYSLTLYSDYINAYDQHEYGGSTSGSGTLTFSATSGSAACILACRGTGHTDQVYATASGTLIGRTVVG